MKLEHLLARYLYHHHQLLLHGIGYFTINETAFNATYGANHPITADVILFQQDAATPADEPLIDYIVSDTGKMRSLAVADVETLLDNGRQLMNIAQQFDLEGIGTLQKNNKGEISFTPGYYLPFAEKNVVAEEISLRQPKRTAGWGYLLGIIILLAAGWWGYRAWFGHADNNTSDTTAGMPTPALPAASSNDNESVAAHSTQHAALKGTTDSIHYYVVFEIADSARAFQRYNELKSWDDDVILYPTGSGKYKLAAPFTTLPEDTTHVKDSISRFFAREVFLEKEIK